MAITATKTQRARVTFLEWLAKTHPQLYQRIVGKIDVPVGLSGFADSLSNVFSTVTESLPKLAETYVTTKAQLEQLKLNLQRAQAGLTPIDVSGAPLPLAPEPQGDVFTLPSPGGISPMWLVLGGLAAFLFLRR